MTQFDHSTVYHNKLLMAIPFPKILKYSVNTTYGSNALLQTWPKCVPPTYFCGPWSFLSFEKKLHKPNFCPYLLRINTKNGQKNTLILKFAARDKNDY